MNKYLLYKYRFIIGYVLLGLSFLFLVFTLPFFAPVGLSEAEQASVVTSYNLHFSSLTSGTLVDLPYHVLQKISILAFGLTPFAIKLPSIIFGLALGFLFVLLLNRWFKNNVALLASVLTILSAPFLYLAGSGTPLIMLVFWPTLLLWLGSRIQGEKHPSVPATFFFAIALTFSIYTPYLIYLVLFIVTFAVLSPHLRFTIKSLPRPHLIAASIITALGVIIWIINLISNPASAKSIFLSDSFHFSSALSNLRLGFAPFFSWTTPIESVYLSPMFNIAIVVLAILGLIATRKGFLASRNAIATCFLIFSFLLTALNPDAALLLILPFAILTAHGLKYLIEKWYSLFPANPYARIFALLPLSTLILTILISTLSHYVNGYVYSPAVANNFSTDLTLVSTSIPDDTPVYIPDSSLAQDFYAVYADRTHKITLLSALPETSTPDDTDPATPKAPSSASLPTTFAVLNTSSDPLFIPDVYSLSKIVTSQKSEDSDRIYLYTLKNS